MLGGFETEVEPEGPNRPRPREGHDAVLKGPSETVMTKLIIPATQSAFPGEFASVDCSCSIVLITI